jgi:hypothetical protein
MWDQYDPNGIALLRKGDGGSIDVLRLDFIQQAAYDA